VLTITFTDAVAAGSCPQESTISRTWRATDDCGNFTTCVQTIVVDDSEAPAITCPPDAVIDCDESTLPGNTGSATATDLCDPSATITFSDNVIGGGCPQESTINRTWTAMDDCGNASTCLQVITVQDDESPAITCPDDITIDCSEGTDPAVTGTATATDNCDPTPTLTFSDTTVGGGGGGCAQGAIHRTWIATDDCGNSSTCEQLIQIEDEVAPVITCPIDITISCGDNTLPGNTGTATASDICDLTPTITFSDVITGGNCPEESTITRTWTAMDDCGNSATCVQIIVVEDSQGLF
jgi:hypothetical protein